MSSRKVTTNDPSAAWRECLRETGLEDACLLAQSRYDPFRRTYLKAGKVYKLVLLDKEITGQARANDLLGEQQILRRCSGIPGVPVPMGYKRSNSHEVLVLEELSGEPLSKLAVTWRELALLLVRLTGLVFRLSWRGISHNDIKPENVLVSSNSKVALIDFDQATQTNFVFALVRSLLGIRIGSDQVHGSVAFIVLKRLLKDRLSPRVIRVFRRMIRDKDVESEYGLPILAEDSSPQARALLLGWKLAQKSDASSPGKNVAYYSLELDGIRFPGERPWEQRWQVLRTITDYSGKRVVELGCNMALLSCFLLKEAEAAAALAVDADKQILAAARTVSSAFGVSPTLQQIDFDAHDEWEEELLKFKGDIVFALNVLNWVRAKKRLLNFLGCFRELVFEGHDSLETETRRLRSVGFERIDVVATTERGRHIFYCRQNR